MAGGGDSQTISDEDTVTEEKSVCVHSWAHMRVDCALSNKNFVVHTCMKRLDYSSSEVTYEKLCVSFTNLTVFAFGAV